jgi:hypothetical protein
MSIVPFQLDEPAYQRIKAVLAGIQHELNAMLVMLIQRSGQQVACEGPAQNLDLTSLASLAAASLAATDGLAQIVGEREFAVLFQQGRSRSIHISSLDGQHCLVLLFGQIVSAGLVRWKVRRVSDNLVRVLNNQRQNQQAKGDSGEFRPESVKDYFTDEDIEKLFGP